MRVLAFQAAPSPYRSSHIFPAHHSPSYGLKDQAASVLWSSRITVIPSRARAVITFSKTLRAVSPISPGLAARASGGTHSSPGCQGEAGYGFGVVLVQDTGASSSMALDQGRRTEFTPSASNWFAIALRGWHSRPDGTKSASSAPYQFTLASLNRSPFASMIHRPEIPSGSRGASLGWPPGGGAPVAHPLLVVPVTVSDVPSLGKLTGWSPGLASR